MTNAQEETVSRAGSRIDSERVRQFALRMTSWPSETGTPGEASFADRLHGLLGELPYFREHPQDLGLLASHGEPLTRTPPGVELVEDHLDRLEYGIYA